MLLSGGARGDDPQMKQTSSDNDSIMSTVPSLGKIHFSLDELCTYIDAHPSLQRAEIVATECYRDASSGVTHRFLVLELHRRDRKNVFLRLDRQRDQRISILRFISGSGRTRANDLVNISDIECSIQLSSRYTFRPSWHQTNHKSSTNVSVKIDKNSLWHQL